MEYLGTPGCPQLHFLESSAEHTYSTDPYLGCRLSIVRRVANCDRTITVDRKLLQDRFKDVRLRLGLVDIIRRNGCVDHLRNSCDVEILLKFVFLGR